GNGEHKCKKCFNKYLEELKNPDKKDDNPAPSPDDKKDHKTPEREPEEPESDQIKNLEKKLEHYKKKKSQVHEKDKLGVQDLTKTVEDNNLTTEQREIKEFFQQNPTLKQSLSQSELEKEVAAQGDNSKNNQDKNG